MMCPSCPLKHYFATISVGGFSCSGVYAPRPPPAGPPSRSIVYSTRTENSQSQTKVEPLDRHPSLRTKHTRLCGVTRCATPPRLLHPSLLHCFRLCSAYCSTLLLLPTPTPTAPELVCLIRTSRTVYPAQSHPASRDGDPACGADIVASAKNTQSRTSGSSCVPCRHSESWSVESG
jgi:hypothetical protein